MSIIYCSFGGGGEKGSLGLESELGWLQQQELTGFMHELLTSGGEQH
jgi:hypothetical protein